MVTRFDVILLQTPMNGSADSGHAAEFGRKCSGTVWMTACVLSLFSFWNGGGSSRSVSCSGGSISNYSGSIGDAVVASAAATSASSFGSGVCSGISGSSGAGSDDGSVLMVEATHKGPPPGVFCDFVIISVIRLGASDWNNQRFKIISQVICAGRPLCLSLPKVESNGHLLAYFCIDFGDGRFAVMRTSQNVFPSSRAHGTRGYLCCKFLSPKGLLGGWN